MEEARKHYTREFKQEALRLASEGKVSLAQVARDLGIPDKLIYRWRQEFEAQGANAFPGQGQPIDDELARLRRESEVLRREREIKKAIAIFSQHQP